MKKWKPESIKCKIPIDLFFPFQMIDLLASMLNSLFLQVILYGVEARRPGQVALWLEFPRLYAVQDNLEEQRGGECYWWNLTHLDQNFGIYT